jgi:hypothetical protein
VQVIIDLVIAITAVYAAAMSTINQLQIRRQMQRIVSVNMKQAVMDLPRIPDGSGGRTATPVHVFVIHVVNPGLTPVMLKGAGMILPDGKSLTQGFAALRRDKQFPLELGPGDGHEVHIDAYEVQKAMQGNGIAGKAIVQGYITTPLKRYKSKRIRFDMKLLADNIKRTEGTWRK